MALQSYKELEVWQKAFDVCVAVYQLTSKFPSDKEFGLSIQLRRASVSVPSNIAEGCARGATQDYVRFLNIARGSAAEIETPLLLATALGFANRKSADPLLAEIGSIQRMLVAMVRKLGAKR
ncbi:MAG: four helix bundle protein [Phycisphaerae bacterium]